MVINVMTWNGVGATLWEDPGYDLLPAKDESARGQAEAEGEPVHRADLLEYSIMALFADEDNFGRISKYTFHDVKSIRMFAV
ncbi:MAG: hypothetical protein MZV70_04910 [Desulfobacterales bacterium]|nr:hypothetical protein [Desulfobacterales bacterium]